MSDLNKLQPQLDEVKAGMMAQVPEEVKAAMTGAAEKLAATDLLAGARQIGDTAPTFTLPNAVGKDTSLSAMLSKGAVVLTFYRGVWCPYCNLQFKALQNALPEIEAAGGSLVAISPSTPDNSLRMADKHNLSFEVLSDLGNNVALDYGLVYRLDESLGPIYVSFGIDIPATNGDDSYLLPIAATYIINRAGVITAAFLDTDYTQRMEPADIIAALKEL